MSPTLYCHILPYIMLLCCHDVRYVALLRYSVSMLFLHIFGIFCIFLRLQKRHFWASTHHTC